jgi:hypothetical protein
LNLGGILNIIGVFDGNYGHFDPPVFGYKLIDFFIGFVNSDQLAKLLFVFGFQLLQKCDYGLRGVPSQKQLHVDDLVTFVI